MTTIITSCKKKPEIQKEKVEIQSVGDEISAPSANDAVNQDVAKKETCVGENCLNAGNDVSETSTENVVMQEEAKVELCAEGNCPCGDGFCAKDSVCIKDKCFCGAYLNKGFIDERAVVSNSYGEFECVRYYYEEQCNSNTEQSYNFLCRRPEGCKTTDGREYPLTDLSMISNSLIHDNPLHDMVLINDVPEFYDNLKIAIWPDDWEISAKMHDQYETLIKTLRLNNCGESLNENLKYMFRYDSSEFIESVDESVNDYSDSNFTDSDNFIVSSDIECDLRKACNDNGITADHILEYTCEIGRAYYQQYGCNDFRSRKRAIGLRCIRPEGCTCGNMHCPKNALCKDGSCKYDIYYNNHACPGKDWDTSKNDIENYMVTAKGCDCADKVDQICFNECWFHTDVDDEDKCMEACQYDYKDILSCYEKCYWDKYDSTMTKTDPCKK